MIIDGQEYQPVATDGKLAIVVCDRGFVLVGRITLIDNHWSISQCACIRKWGTTKGLGELASEGPTPSTILDPQPLTLVHELQVVQIITCKEEPWIV